VCAILMMLYKFCASRTYNGQGLVCVKEREREREKDPNILDVQQFSPEI